MIQTRAAAVSALLANGLSRALIRSPLSMSAFSCRGLGAAIAALIIVAELSAEPGAKGLSLSPGQTLELTVPGVELPPTLYTMMTGKQVEPRRHCPAPR